MPFIPPPRRNNDEDDVNFSQKWQLDDIIKKLDENNKLLLSIAKLLICQHGNLNKDKSKIECDKCNLVVNIK